MVKSKGRKIAEGRAIAKMKKPKAKTKAKNKNNRSINRNKDKICGICGKEDNRNWAHHWKKWHKGMGIFEAGEFNPSVWEPAGKKPKMILWKDKRP